ncbi:MAG TPA: hypothetical protein VMZ51_06065 [Acidimicrobiales bacterium]|nr:hypothetical protein [Acidimicrobiales bacterium]
MEPNETTPFDSPRTRGRLNSTIVAAGAALAMVVAGLGIAGAQTGSSSTTTPDSSPNSADAPADKPAEGACHAGPGRGHHPGAKVALSVAAGAIGISEADLATALRSGRSIAQVAGSKDVDVQKVIDALVADAKKRIAEKVAAGELTQAEADKRLARLNGRITSLVHHVGDGPGRHGRRGHGGPEGGDGPRGPAGPDGASGFRPGPGPDGEGPRDFGGLDGPAGDVGVDGPAPDGTAPTSAPAYGNA